MLVIHVLIQPTLGRSTVVFIVEEYSVYQTMQFTPMMLKGHMYLPSLLLEFILYYCILVHCK